MEGKKSVSRTKTDQHLGWMRGKTALEESLQMGTYKSIVGREKYQ